MEKCELCENLVNDNDWSVCENCREKAKTFENAVEMGNSWREEISINGFLHHCFTQQEIEDILYSYFTDLPEEEQKKKIDSFCEEDMLYFVRWITKKCKK